MQVRAEREDKRYGGPEAPPSADEFLQEGTRPRSFWDVMTFAGPAPEVINGRLVSWARGAVCGQGCVGAGNRCSSPLIATQHPGFAHTCYPMPHPQAMLGFTAAMAAELATGRGVVQQFQQVRAVA